MSAGICPHCKKDCKNLGVHLRYCKENPSNKPAMKQESILSALPSTPVEPPILPNPKKDSWLDRRTQLFSNIISMCLLFFRILIVIAVISWYNPVLEKHQESMILIFICGIAWAIYSKKEN